MLHLSSSISDHRSSIGRQINTGDQQAQLACANTSLPADKAAAAENLTIHNSSLNFTAHARCTHNLASKARKHALVFYMSDYYNT